MKSGKPVDRLYQRKHLSLSQANNAKCQYNDLLQSVCVIHQEKSSSFDFTSDRVEKPLGQFLEKDKRFSDLRTACIFVFVLAQGQSQVKRGFNIGIMLVEKLEETSIKV